MLPLAEVVLLAGIQGLAEALPISRSGHDAVARLWLDPGRSAAALESILHVATASALLVGARRHLVAAVSEGLRAVARPSLVRSSPGAHDAAVLVIAAGTSLLARALAAPYVELWSGAPLAIGFGLVWTGLIVATMSLAPTGRLEAPPLSLAALLGLVHGTGVLPGGSDVGAALVIAMWMGTKPDRALDLSLALTGVTLLVSFVSGLGGVAGTLSIGAPAIVFGLLTAFLGATVAIGLARSLLEKHALARLAFWILPLGFATVSYGRSFGEVSRREAPASAVMAVLSMDDKPCNPLLPSTP
ncbi:undecaprenyl-diphosphate phosphatase [Polyangium sp. y55x31]|uniref:undecaprenyl-diphosphate phosphatase n=1 Tax=Polyangium sp. y55x31 TaxID=3042688 RepID=UPI0024823569|nr:undecaprenyl-diphosphate phosphatase [Polyangium sp. y55x31]MDI1482266.1 undecaprenyl-diphosphate phosphatase [Polyangium sp. y55x31]